MIVAPLRSTLLTALLLCIGACGGGGGGGGNRQPTAPPPVNQAPTPAFSIDVTNGDAPLVVTADARASNDADGQIVAYDWDFGGTAAIGSVARFTFTQAGNFTVALTVTDDDGEQATTSRAVTVNAAEGTSRLSGTVRILSSTAVDRDVNDRETIPQSNNTFIESQPIPIPVTLGGYANVAGSGEPLGNLFAAGDPRDLYQVSLNGGEVIVLNIAEPTADLDLILWDEELNFVDASLGLGPTETLDVSTAGNYFIDVTPISGASNYVLYVGQDASSAAAAGTGPRASDPFIPGELIVKRKQRHSLMMHMMQGLRELVREPDDSDSRYGPPSLFALTDAGTMPQLPAGARTTAAQRLRLRTLSALKTLRQNPDVRYAELNGLVQPHAAPDDSFFGSQWHYPAINLPLAWDTTQGDAGVIVAVVDTGVLLNHPDLRDQLVSGYDFISDSSRARDGDGIDPDPADPGDLEFGASSSFHGTHVAGTIGAGTDNGRGIAGAGWSTRLMPMRALGEGGGSTFDIVQAVRYAAGLSNNSNTVPARRADIINLSLGSTFSSQSEQDAYSAAIGAGVLVVASAGNESTSVPAYPAAYDGVIGVGATTITGEAASYSNFGGFVDVAAPGGSNVTDLNGDGLGDGVISTTGDDSSGAIEFGYGALSGTSMAAPHVAGVIALMKAIHPDLTPAEFDAALVAGELTDDIGDPGRDDRFGYGLINAQKAVIAAQSLANGQGSDPGPILTASASTLNFGGFLTTLDVQLQNAGTGNLQVGAAIRSDTWVEVDAPTTPDGLGAYTLTIDRTGLSDGAYQSTITFPSDANDVTVTLIMQVSSLNLEADAGRFYVIVVDENGATVGDAVRVEATQGEYPFVIDAVPAGQYRLFAGSDADDDANLCDAGEACGAYPTLDSPAFIAVNGDRDGLDFESAFRVNLTTTGAAQAAALGADGVALEKSTQAAPPDEAED